ncbi:MULTISPECIES: DNA-processing protein DprA [Arsenicicoccus]|uniref:DNA-processing protein DprA n=1 Tax=Arsenicicoccus TaxID=267408 RepID=UPI00257E5EC0|nr:MULTISPECIES: DNA-processing protein DprA [Arsenicicoccus]
MRPDELPRDERSARALWSRIAEPADARVAALLQKHDPVTALHLLPGDGIARHDALRDRLVAAEPGRDLALAQRCGARLLVPADEEWPPGLDDLEPPKRPYCLWVRGPVQLAEAMERSVSVVGSRAATEYGQRVAADLGAGLAQRGFAVVSGAAFGIDAAAHRGALAEDGETVAVLAGGVERPYPAAHERLIARVAETGAVVSEVAPGCAPTRSRFLLRNRLIAALSQGTVVVEAGYRSGALSTMRAAAELVRPVAVVPGPVTSMTSAGCHQAVRDGVAELVTDAAEVAELCGRMGTDLAPERRAQVQELDLLGDADAKVRSALPVRNLARLESIALAASLTVPETRASLGRLVTLGLAETRDGGYRLGAEARRRPARPSGGPCP